LVLKSYKVTYSKVRTLVTALITRVRLMTSSTLQSVRRRLIDMMVLYLDQYPLVHTTDNSTAMHHKDTTAPINYINRLILQPPLGELLVY